MHPVERCDIAVIGLGGIGSATAWFAAQRAVGHVALGAGHGYKFDAGFGKTLAALAAAWEPNWLV